MYCKMQMKITWPFRYSKFLARSMPRHFPVFENLQHCYNCYLQESFSLEVDRRNVSPVARPCFCLCGKDIEGDREDGAEELLWLQRRSLMENMGKEAPCHRKISPWT
jgi:hypothetical protein